MLDHAHHSKAGQKKKVVCAISQLGLGGSETQLVRFLQYVDKSKYECEVWLTNNEDARRGDIEKLGIPVKAFFGPFVVSRLLAMYRESKSRPIDIWWSWSYHLNAYHIAIPRKVKKIGSLRGRLTYHREKVGRYHRLCESGLDLLVVNSSELLADCYNAGLKVRSAWIGNVAPRPKDHEAPDARKCAFGELNAHAKDVVITIGRLDENKDTELLIRALAVTRRESLCGVVVGDGPLRSGLERLCSDLGVSRRIQFIGEVPDVMPYMKAADLLVHTSRSEGLPNVVMEAICNNVPVLARDIGGVRDLIPSSEYGWLFDHEDPERLMRLIDEALLKRDESMDKCMRASKRMDDLFSPEPVMSRIEEWFDFLLGYGPTPDAVHFRG